MRRWSVLPFLLLLACSDIHQAPAPTRRAVSPSSHSGWARLPLDASAQRHRSSLWLSDAAGTSIPFELERDGLWEPRTLKLEQVLLGRDSQNRPSASFSISFPEGWQVREREHLQVDLELGAEGPWVCQADIARRNGDAPFLTLEPSVPIHLFDLGPSGHRTSLTIPWDARDYRITLTTSQGQAPTIRRITVTARTRPEALQADELMTPRTELTRNGQHEVWTLRLDAPHRVVGMDLFLHPPAAPLQPHVSTLETLKGKDHESPIPVDGLLWNLPALQSSATRLTFSPHMMDTLRIRMPEGARLANVALLIRRDVLLFPAEAGRPVYLHGGGGVRRAPGSLSSLPNSSRAVYTHAPLSLGPEEVDPHGIPIVAPPTDRLRGFMPWLAGLAVVVLGLAGWRMMRTPPPGP